MNISVVKLKLLLVSVVHFLSCIYPPVLSMEVSQIEPTSAQIRSMNTLLKFDIFSFGPSITPTSHFNAYIEYLVLS